MKMTQYPPGEILVPEIRVTSRFDEETMTMFRDSIGATPGSVFVICALVDGKPVLIDGLHRLNEAIKGHWPVIDVALVDGDMADVLTLNLRLDHVRGKHPASEMVNVIEALTKELGLNSEQIAKKTGFKRDYIEKLQSVTRLTPMIRAALDREEIKVSHAYELARLTDPIQQETVFYQLQMYRWGAAELRTFITDLLNIKLPPAPGPGVPPVRILVRCAFCGEEHDPRAGQIANPNTCSTCAGILFAATAQVRAEVAAAARARQAAEASRQPDTPGADTPPVNV